MKKMIWFLCFAVVMTASGCGQMGSTGRVSEKTYPAAVSNPQVKAINEQIGIIKDQTQAVNAVNNITTYIGSRLVDNSTSESSAPLLTPDLVQKLADKEADVLTGVGAGQTDTSMLDIGAITDSVNSVGSTEGVRVTDDMVTTAKLAVEQSMPNLNPDKKDVVTPLEASIIAYAIVSGDDGTASPESVNIPKDKVAEFINKITE